MYIYIEEVFFVNLLINMGVMLSVAKVLKVKSAPYIISAVFVSVFACLSVIFSSLNIFLIKALVYVVSVIIACRPVNVKNFSITFALIFCAYIFCGGAVSLLSIKYSAKSVFSAYIGVSYISLFIGCMIGLLVFYLLCSFGRKVINMARNTVEAEIYCYDKLCRVNFLKDTGNLSLTQNGEPLNYISRDIFLKLTDISVFEFDAPESYELWKTDNSAILKNVSYAFVSTLNAVSYVPVVMAEKAKLGKTVIAPFYIAPANIHNAFFDGIISASFTK